MTILQSLAALYDRLDGRGKRNSEILVPSTGLKLVPIDFILEIDAGGRFVALKSRIDAGRKRGFKLMVPGTVYNPKPAAGDPIWDDLSFRGRTSGRRSFLFWDKSSYVLGVAARKGAKGSAPEPEISAKSLDDHRAFVAAHRALLDGTGDPALLALLQFLETWRPEQWEALKLPAEALDKNIAIEVTASRRFLHDLPEARERAAKVIASSMPTRTCLISGKSAPYATGHPMFQGVAGAQSSGAALVSFNADAFVSYDLKKAEASPVSEEAAFKYGAALNWLLERGNGRSFRLGETTVVFWADDKAHAEEAEEVFHAQMSDGAPPAAETVSDESDEESDDCEDDAAGDAFDMDADQARLMRDQGQDARFQRRAPDAGELDKDARLHVLGLSPNSGRIAVRFWLVESWGDIQANIALFKADIRIEPPPRNPDKKAYALLFETAVQGEAKNIPPRLGGEFARAILSGGPYPQTLLAAVVSRIRVDKEINAERAGLCKAVINRHNGKEIIPVALDPMNVNSAYRLGRLFALIEGAQKAALPKIKATVKDRYFGAACATPARVFPLLHKNAMNHLAAIRKERGSGLAHWMENEIGSVWSGLSDDLPRSLRLEEQGRFIAGYYHQRFSKTEATPKEAQELLASDPEDTDQ